MWCWLWRWLRWEESPIGEPESPIDPPFQPAVGLEGGFPATEEEAATCGVRSWEEPCPQCGATLRDVLARWGLAVEGPERAEGWRRYIRQRQDLLNRTRGRACVPAPHPGDDSLDTSWDPGETYPSPRPPTPSKPAPPAAFDAAVAATQGDFLQKGEFPLPQNTKNEFFPSGSIRFSDAHGTLGDGTQSGEASAQKNKIFPDGPLRGTLSGNAPAEHPLWACADPTCAVCHPPEEEEDPNFRTGPHPERDGMPPKPVVPPEWNRDPFPCPRLTTEPGCMWPMCACEHPAQEWDDRWPPLVWDSAIHRPTYEVDGKIDWARWSYLRLKPQVIVAPDGRHFAVKSMLWWDDGVMEWLAAAQKPIQEQQPARGVHVDAADARFSPGHTWRMRWSPEEDWQSWEVDEPPPFVPPVWCDCSPHMQTSCVQAACPHFKTAAQRAREHAMELKGETAGPVFPVIYTGQVVSFPTLGSPTVSPYAGEQVFRADDGRLWVYADDKWLALPAATSVGPAVWPIPTTGDVVPGPAKPLTPDGGRAAMLAEVRRDFPAASDMLVAAIETIACWAVADDWHRCEAGLKPAPVNPYKPAAVRPPMAAWKRRAREDFAARRRAARGGDMRITFTEDGLIEPADEQAVIKDDLGRPDMPTDMLIDHMRTTAADAHASGHQWTATLLAEGAQRLAEALEKGAGDA